ncbi:3106_t:CDS:2, partial [Gigaspora margarita]
MGDNENDGDESDYINAYATSSLRSHENDDIITSSASFPNHRSDNDILTLLVSSPACETDNVTTSLQISPIDLAINIRNGMMMRVENEEPNEPSMSALIHEPV